MYSLLLFFFNTLVTVLSNPAIRLQRCKIEDEICVTNSAKVAYPLILQPNAEIGAENLEPLYQNLIEGNLSVLKYNLKNTTHKGFGSCEVQSAKFLDKEGNLLKIELLCPSFTLAGQYEIKGRLITSDVEGDGDYTIITKKYTLNVEMELETVTKNGKDYKSVKDFKLKAVPLENLVYDFKNLFNGQKDLADQVHKFVNENWKVVAESYQDPIWIADIKKIVKNANIYLSTLPFDEFQF